MNLSSLSSDFTIYDLHHKKFDFKCKKCGNEFHNKLSFGNYYKYGTFSSCSKCHPYSCSSFAEKEIVEFIKTFYDGEVLTNKRTIIPNSELDIYVPKKKLAIEYDGIWWHTEEAGTPSSYHLDKTNKCENAGIQLIHIFENEWKYKKDIIKSHLKHLFGIYDKTIYARKCIAKEISVDKSIQFQNDNCIYENVKTKVNIGLFHNDELISIMAFDKS